MSTKIYTAYRLKPGIDFWKFARNVQEKGRKNITKVLQKRVYPVVMSMIDPTSEEYKNHYGKDDYSKRRNLAYDKIRKGFIAQLSSYQRNEFDFNVYLNVYEYNRRKYIIPYCDMYMKNVLNFLSRDKRLEDFRYWNNTDAPSHISKKEWNKRGEIWDKIYKQGWYNSIIISVCDRDTFSVVDPYWLGLLKK